MSPSDSVTFTVPRVPMAINKLMRSHWAVRRKNKALWMDEIRYGAGVKGMSVLRAWADLERKVRIEIVVHHSKAFDGDNLYSCAKNLLDGMKSMRLIVDDSPKHIDLSVTQELCPRKAARTCFTVSKLSP